MFKKIRLLVSSTALLVSTMASAQNLTSYEQIADALSNGTIVMLNITADKCKVISDTGHSFKRLAIRFSDLYEFETTLNAGKKMLAMATQETGLFGNKTFNWTRNLAIVFEDGTVIIADDEVNSGNFDLNNRTMLTCKLSADNSEGATAKAIL